MLPILDPAVPLPVANCLAVPMLMGNEQVGAIVLINKPPVFIEAELKELETFAQTTALAIKGARTELERKKTMDQLRQAQKMEAIGQLAGGIAHDFNNLLTVINGYSTLLIRSLKQDEALKKEAEQILHAGERAADLTRQLLAFSRRQIIEPRTMSINMQVKNLESMLCRLIGEHIELLTDLSSELGAIKADPGQIEQILLNLVVNARDALSNGGRITVSTKNAELDENFARSHEGASAGRYVMLSISDNGQGMPEDVKRRIFEPFFTTKEQGKGTGLGLATVYGIVKQSKGYVLVESELGEGSVFSIYFPREDAPTEEEEAPTDQEDTSCNDSTILVVEDEQGVLDLAVQTLKSHGFTVLQAIDPIAAQHVFDAHRGDIDLLLTDVMMPFMTGPELAEKLQKQKPSLKIAFFSGYADGNLDLDEATAKGYPIISKPFTAATLVKKIAHVIDREQQAVMGADERREAIQ
jgi:signal transduction histidine kinase/CheY-like chemotaxis protein